MRMRHSLALHITALLAACTPASALHTTEASAYEQEQLACVDQAKTLDESHVCRDRVRAKWGRFLDGGAE